MSIHVILGKPGSGKSLYATSRLIQELRETGRNIVTNLPLRLERLNEYLQEHYPNDDLRMVQRVRMLSDLELRTFWNYRGPEITSGINAANIYDDHHSTESKPYGDDKGAGVAYFLDEAHIAFNARDWANIGKGALHYLSQHRKLGDIVFVITQAPGNLDKQFRSVAEDFTVLRNEYTAKYGPFRGRGRFVRKVYLSEPQGNSEPFDKGTFTLDAEGIASCYDTAKGIGVHGSKADIGRRAKGISIWWVVPAALVMCLAAVAIPWWLGRTASGFIAGGVSTDGPARPDAAPAASPRAAGGFPSPSGEGEGARGEQRSEPSADSPLQIVGVLRSGDRIHIHLSNGVVLSEGQSEWLALDRNGLLLADGRRIPFRRAAPVAVGRAPLPSLVVAD